MRSPWTGVAALEVPLAWGPIWREQQATAQYSTDSSRGATSPIRWNSATRNGHFLDTTMGGWFRKRHDNSAGQQLSIAMSITRRGNTYIMRAPNCLRRAGLCLDSWRSRQVWLILSQELNGWARQLFSIYDKQPTYRVALQANRHIRTQEVFRDALARGCAEPGAA